MSQRREGGGCVVDAGGCWCAGGGAADGGASGESSVVAPVQYSAVAAVPFAGGGLQQVPDLTDTSLLGLSAPYVPGSMKMVANVTDIR